MDQQDRLTLELLFYKFQLGITPRKPPETTALLKPREDGSQNLNLSIWK